MKIEQKRWSKSTGWIGPSSIEQEKALLVLAFGDRSILEEGERFEELKRLYPKAHIVQASTSGNIFGASIEDQSIIATAIAFEKQAEIKISRINIHDLKDSYQAGEFLGKNLPLEGLVHVFLLSDGHLVNGSELVKGILSIVPTTVAVTGGLAGDGNRFEKTVVGVDAPAREGEIVAVGFYSPHLKFGYGSIGGWDPFGIERKITRSSANILYELDGRSALDIYKTYLGEQVKELPSSALLFPLAIRPDQQSKPLVRTILSINEKDKSMVFAGDVPEGWYAQLMKANFDRLVDGAVQAASSSYEALGKQTPQLAILISCVGRRLVLGPRTEEEIEGVQEIIGKEVTLAGFYSYGEIAPMAPHASCELHNQTMTITTIIEE